MCNETVSSIHPIECVVSILTGCLRRLYAPYVGETEALRRSPPEGSLGRAPYVLIRSVKTNKALLLTRVTEPGGMRRGPLKRAGRCKGGKLDGENNFVCKRKRKP